MTIYADNAATTPLCDAAYDAMTAAMRDCWANPSSPHRAGQEAARRLLLARRTIAACLGCQPQEVYFTSGGTEADNWALISAAREGAKHGKRRLVASAIEHHAVLHTLESLRRDGFDYTLIPVGSDGIVQPEALERVLSADTAVVSVMCANNETGVMQPLEELAALCRKRGIVFHTDAVQAAGHVPLSFSALGCDMMSVSAHKFYGPKGIGALCRRMTTPLHPLLFGGGQERGMRPSTENVAAAEGMAAALEYSCSHMREHSAYTAELRDRLIAGVRERIPDAVLCGTENSASRLPGTACFCFPKISGEALALTLSMAGIYVSSGAACTTGTDAVSHVLTAMGIPERLAAGAVRFSLDRRNTPDEIDRILTTLPEAVEKLRRR